MRGSPTRPLPAGSRLKPRSGRAGGRNRGSPSSVRSARRTTRPANAGRLSLSQRLDARGRNQDTPSSGLLFAAGPIQSQLRIQYLTPAEAHQRRWRGYANLMADYVFACGNVSAAQPSIGAVVRARVRVSVRAPAICRPLRSPHRHCNPLWRLRARRSQRQSLSRRRVADALPRRGVRSAALVSRPREDPINGVTLSEFFGFLGFLAA
jgi:hypothetical protein